MFEKEDLRCRCYNFIIYIISIKKKTPYAYDHVKELIFLFQENKLEIRYVLVNLNYKKRKDEGEFILKIRLKRTP